MDLELAYSILEILETMWDVIEQMKKSFAVGNISEFNMLSEDLRHGLTAIRNISSQNIDEDRICRLKDSCTCALISLDDIKKCVSYKPGEVQWKLECELLTFVEETYRKFFYNKIVRGNPNKKEEFLKCILKTGTFPKLLQTERDRVYTCDLSISVLAYNHLDYSKCCIESILNNLPRNITYEIILRNNGSTDETKTYFDSVPGVHVINLAINRLFPFAAMRAFSGKYSLHISNDIVIGKNAIENMYRAISEHEDYGWVVPATPAVSNLQAIPAEYHSIEEFRMFAEQNNIYDENAHEMRVRLCNPVVMIRTDLYNQLYLEMYEQMCCVQNVASFPDDKMSLWMRRNSYKNILAKDAYCHHFGSITLKDEIQQQNEQKFYLEGRREFYNAFGVDPWGTGFCYDAVFLNRVVGEEHGHVEVLGINCGLGSNSLKIKEQIKEYCHNLDTCLSNITDDSSFILDLKGISDTAQTVTTIKELKAFLSGQAYQYIVWETPFLLKYKFKTVLEVCMGALAPGGKLIIKLTEQSREAIIRNFPDREELGNDWVICQRGEQI